MLVPCSCSTLTRKLEMFCASAFKHWKWNNLIQMIGIKSWYGTPNSV